MDHAQRPLPQPTRITQPYWDAARQSRLVIQQCGCCKTRQFYPREFCTACLSDSIEWIDCGGGETVYGHIIPEVHPGQKVREGQRIGRIDDPGAVEGFDRAPHRRLDLDDRRRPGIARVDRLAVDDDRQPEHAVALAEDGGEDVEVLVTEGPARVRELIGLGARFDTAASGEITLTREGGHHRDRIAHAGGDATGAAIQRALHEAVRQTAGGDVPPIRFLNPTSHAIFDAVAEARENGIEAYSTADAGPNVAVIVRPHDAEALAEKLSGFGDVRVVGPGPGAHLLTADDEVPPADAATTAAGEGSRA